MENKYYTPETEEFHVGFEYEYYYKNEWHKHNLDGSPIIHHELDEFDDDLMKLAHAICRVKYLDREDIESLGFYQNGTDDRIYRNSDGIILNTGWGSPVIKDRFTTVITHQVFDESKLNVVHENFLFNGTIKNKSELKRLLKQLGI